MKLHRLTKGYTTISIIGMEKNVGKTTVMNAILEDTRGRLKLGLTSIGRDGEDRDRVTSTHKPKIWVEGGTLIATAKDGLFSSDITREILETTGISTPMGEVIIARALTSGYVDLAGPSISSQVRDVRNRMLNHGAHQIIVDGALGRLGCTYIDTDSVTILSTGASVAPDMHQVIGETLNRVALLQLKKVEEEPLKEYREFSHGERVTYLGAERRELSLESVLGHHKRIVEEMPKDTRYLFIRGAVVSKLVEELIKNRNRFKRLSLIGEDGTKFFIEQSLFKKAGLCNIDFRVMTEINLGLITINPTSPTGYEFDSMNFKRRLQEQVDIPVIDVLGEDYEISR